MTVLVKGAKRLVWLLDGAKLDERYTERWPWVHSDKYPPIVYLRGVAYADTGEHNDNEERARLYCKVPDVTLAE